MTFCKIPEKHWQVYRELDPNNLSNYDLSDTRVQELIRKSLPLTRENWFKGKDYSLWSWKLEAAMPSGLMLNPPN